MAGRLEQTISFVAGKPLGLSIDEDLRIARVTDATSPAVMSARYGVVHWRIRSVGDRLVKTRNDLLGALGGYKPGAEMAITLEAPAVVEGLEMPAEAAIIAKEQAGLASQLSPTAGSSPRQKPPQEEEEVAPVEGAEIEEVAPIAVETKKPPALAAAAVALAATIEAGTPRSEGSSRLTRPREGGGVPPNGGPAGPKRSKKEDEQLRGMFRLPTLTIGSDSSMTRIVTGSCSWRLNEGDPRRFDVAIRACASHCVVGIRTFDCGDIYAGVEELVGRFVATARGQSRALAGCVRLHTKVVPDATFSLAASKLSAKERAKAIARHVEASVWRSANRLGVAHIDLVYLHWWDWEVSGFEDAVRALERLRQRGAIRALGVTNVDAENLKFLLDAGHRIACVQVNVSVVDRRAIESGLCSLISEEGTIRLLAFGVLMGGLLTDEYLEKPECPDPATLPSGIAANMVLVQDYGGWAAFQDLLKVMRKVADAYERRQEHDTGSISIAMIAIAWALQLPGVSAVVLGAKDATHSRDAAFAASNLKLEPEDLLLIEQEVATRGPHGAIYGVERRQSSKAGMPGGGFPLQLFNKCGPSRAYSSVEQLREASHRLLQLHSAYRASMPPLPPRIAGLKNTEVAVALNKDDWVASSAYLNLSPTELREVIKGFLCEIDCLPDDPEEQEGGVLPNRGELRTHAAKMLASAEQFIFLHAKRAQGTATTGPGPPKSHDDMTRQTADEAQAAFRRRIVTACMESAKNPDGGSPDAPPPGCSLQ